MRLLPSTDAGQPAAVPCTSARARTRCPLGSNQVISNVSCGWPCHRRPYRGAGALFGAGAAVVRARPSTGAQACSGEYCNCLACAGAEGRRGAPVSVWHSRVSSTCNIRWRQGCGLAGRVTDRVLRSNCRSSVLTTGPSGTRHCAHRVWPLLEGWAGQCRVTGAPSPCRGGWEMAGGSRQLPGAASASVCARPVPGAIKPRSANTVAAARMLGVVCDVMGASS